LLLQAGTVVLHELLDRLISRSFVEREPDALVASTGVFVFLVFRPHASGLENEDNLLLVSGFESQERLPRPLAVVATIPPDGPVVGHHHAANIPSDLLALGVQERHRFLGMLTR